MRVFNKFKRVIMKCDFFCTTEYFRYKNQPQFRTMTGGVFSIILVSVFASMFMSQLIKTIQKDIITYTVDVGYTGDDQIVAFNATDPCNFLFGLEIVGIDLNAPERYLDIVMTASAYNKETELKTQTVPLQKCTPEHFNMTQALYNRYNQLGAHGWLCPPKDYTFILQGKYTSPISQLIQLSISKCNDATDPNRTCLNDTAVAQYLAENNVFIFNCYFVNPVINPSSQTYLDYYLNDLNYGQFTTDYSVKQYGYITEFDITTDTSLLPFIQNVEDYGVIIDDYFQVQTQPVPNLFNQVFDDTYYNLYLYKSGIYRSYTRAFNKLDTFFSYIGGLFGSMMAAMIIMRGWTEGAYQLAIGQKLYRYSHDEPLNYSSNIGCEPDWPSIKRYHDTREESVEQLDIRYLFKRIVFMERALLALFNDKQLQGLHLMRKMTIAEAKEVRKMFDIKGKVHKFMLDGDESQKQEKQSKEEKSQLNNQQTPGELNRADKLQRQPSIIFFSKPNKVFNNLSTLPKEEFDQQMPQARSNKPKTRSFILQNFSEAHVESQKSSQQGDRDVEDCRSRIEELVRQAKKNSLSRKIIEKIDMDLIKQLTHPERKTEEKKMEKKVSNKKGGKGVRFEDAFEQD